MKTLLNHLRAYWLFVRIVWRDFNGTPLKWSTAWEISKNIWLK